MQQRDFLVKQIEEMGKVLAKVVANFLKLKLDGKLKDGIEITNQQFEEKLDISIETILELDKPKLQQYFEQLKTHTEYIESISEYFFEIGTSYLEKENALKYLNKAQDLLSISDNISQTASFARIQNLNKIKAKIQNLNNNKK